MDNRTGRGLREQGQGGSVQVWRGGEALEPWRMPRMGGKKRSGPQEAREVGQASAGRPRTRMPLGAWVMDGSSWRVATVGSGFWQLPGSVVLLVPVCGFCSFSLRPVPSPPTRGMWGGPRGCLLSQRP